MFGHLMAYKESAEDSKHASMQWIGSRNLLPHVQDQDHVPIDATIHGQPVGARRELDAR